MKASDYSLLSDKSRIGISVDSDSLDSNNIDEAMPKYASFKMPRLSKVNSFLIIDEQFHITKMDHTGKKGIIYHVYRVSDGRYVCPSTLDKEATMNMVRRKYERG